MNLYLENTGKGILITFLLLIGSMLYAQNNSKITIKKKNISLQTALADIRDAWTDNGVNNDRLILD